MSAINGSGTLLPTSRGHAGGVPQTPLRYVGRVGCFVVRGTPSTVLD